MNRVSIGSDNGLSPIRRQAIIWTNAGLLSIGPQGTNFSEILFKTPLWQNDVKETSYYEVSYAQVLLTPA